MNNPALKNIVKDVAHQAVDLTSQHVKDNYGLNVSTRDLHGMIDQHPHFN